jgi:hypothetical protein
MASDEIGVPTWVAQELDQRRQVCLARSAQVVFHLAPILKDLDQEGVPTMVLKGALLAETLYPDPGARSFFDVDLLVAPEHFPGAYRTLMRRGYVALRPFDFSNPPLVGHYLNSILCRGTAPQSPLIHLHWHLVNTSLPSDDYVYRIPMEEIWGEAQKLELWDAPVLAPEPHHLLVQLAEHAYREGFRKLTRLVDVAWATPAPDDRAFWDETLQLAQAWGLATPCFSSLFLCQGLGLARVPEQVLARLRPSDQGRWADLMLRRTLEKPGIQRWGKLLYLAHRPGLTGKLRFLSRSVGPPVAEIEAIYGLAPGSLGAFGYLHRITHRLLLGLKRSWVAAGRLLS